MTADEVFVKDNWPIEVRRLRLLGEVPDPHILDHALAKRGHDALLRNGVATIATPERVTIAEAR
jgi:hypothetical protein